jgi:small ligand-binding sensory domain FIST
VNVPAGAGMRWSAAVSRLEDATAAASEVADTLAARLGPGRVDLALAFFSAHHVACAEALANALRTRLAPHCLAGASACGVVANLHEVEHEPALSVIAARLPDVAVTPFVVTNEGWDEAASDASAFVRMTPGVRTPELVILLGDPFSLDLAPLFSAFERHEPGTRFVGGLASAAPRPGSNALFLNDWLAREGGFAIALSGALRADVLVSQGCHAIGPSLRVTGAQGNGILELDGEPAVARVERVLEQLGEKERGLLRLGLYLGVPVNQQAEGRGDYLIRPLLGADREHGRLAVGDRVAEGQHVRLHVRDATTAREDLELLLTPQAFDVPAQAALLFACNSRGRGFYGAPDGDVGPLQAALGGETPVAGMFCAGEIGPLGRRNHLHGHTASIAILRAAAAQ